MIHLQPFRQMSTNNKKRYRNEMSNEGSLDAGLDRSGRGSAADRSYAVGGGVGAGAQYPD